MPIIIPDNLPYTAPGIECLRLGARRGGIGIGCCAIDVFQGFSNHPDAACPPIPFFEGDSWTPHMDCNTNKQLHMKGTNAEVFRAYLAHGSFTPYPEQDHAFIAVLTEEQIHNSIGRSWLKILKEEGFEWMGAVSNSVYSEYHPNHIFILIRNTRDYMDDEELEMLKKPPQAWTELDAPTETPAERFYKKHCHEYEAAHEYLVPVSSELAEICG